MRGELKTYQAKRRFEQTPEPKGAQRAGEKDARRFVIQRHAATRLHYDFRIEADGVLKSWAVTKAPSRDPAIKRLAVEVEDHPLDYGDFEGTIPAGNYGAGTVQLWDVGNWEPQEADLEAAWARGQIKMILHGERLKGKWALIRLKSDRGKPSKRNNWLLLKEKDEHAVAGEGDALAQIDASVTTGRSLAQIAEGDAQWTSSKPTRRKAPPKPAPSKATSKAKRPHAFVPIQLCKGVDHPPSATGWAHEIKFDGYRLQIGIGGGQAVLRTRKGLDWSDRFPELATDAAGWPDAVIDGELCALDDDHMPDFSALQAAISEGETDRLVYFAFDLLFEGAEDLRKLPLAHRKARLQAYIDRLGAKEAARLRYVEHFASTGQAVLESACRMHLEGVISKKLDAPYHAGRSSSWVKSKCRGRDEVVIGGWSSEGGSRFRSLLVGVREKGGMKYLGRVGTGFGETATRLLMPALKAEAADNSPFVGPGAPKGGKDIHWVKPRLVAEIEHGGYTESGALRHAAFKGLRDDKTAEDVTDAPQAPAAPQAP
jgi:bifunctional non-homologous end joining protein LigD